MYGQELVENIRLAVVKHRLDAIKADVEPTVVTIVLTPQSYNEVRLVAQDKPVWWQEVYRDNGNLEQRIFGCAIFPDYRDQHGLSKDGLFFKLLQSS